MTDVLKSNITEGQKRPFAAHGYAELGGAGGLSLLHGVFEPGWRWSEDVAPLAKTDTCQVHHQGYVISGSMKIRMDDGTETEVSAGDLFDLPAGHDAWVTQRRTVRDGRRLPRGDPYATPPGTAEANDDAMKLVRRGYEAFNTGDAQTLMDSSPRTSPSTCRGTDRSRAPTRAPRQCSATTGSSPSTPAGRSART